MDAIRCCVCVMTIISAIFFQLTSASNSEKPTNIKQTTEKNNEDRENKAIFTLYDLNTDGFLSPIEMTLVFQRIDHGPDVDEFVTRIKKFYTRYEKSGDGQLNLNEFLRAFRSSPPPTHVRPVEKYVLEAFKMFDEDSNGFLSFDEVTRQLQALTSEVTVRELNKAITGADRNSNGIIDYSEFARALRKHSFDLPSVQD